MHPSSPTVQPTSCPGCQKQVTDFDPAPCPICGRTAAERYAAPPARNGWQQFRDWMLQPPGWAMQLSVLIGTLGWMYTETRQGIVPFLFGLALGFFWLIVITCWAFHGLFWLAYTKRICHSPQFYRGMVAFLWLPISLLLYTLSNQTGILLQISFALHHSALETAAREQPASKSDLNPPINLGFYRVQFIKRTGNRTFFTVTSNNFISRTFGGFAKCPQGCGTQASPYSNLGGTTIYRFVGSDWYWFKQVEHWD